MIKIIKSYDAMLKISIDYFRTIDYSEIIYLTIGVILIMKKILLLFVLFSMSIIAQDTTSTTKSSTISIDILRAPESVMIYKDMLYISNLGVPENSGDGFIVQANLDGSDAKKLFENQLDSPKGFTFISDDLIVIADQVNTGAKPGHVVLANIESGKIISKLTIENSKFLNDIALVNKSTVALTDTGAGKVYIISIKKDKMSYKEIASDIIGANGITYFEKMLYIAGSTFGGDNNGGHIYKMNISGKKNETLTKDKIGMGGLDGIKIADKMLYVSDWGSGKDNGSVIYIYDLKKGRLVSKMSGPLTSIADFDIYDDFIWAPQLSKNSIKKISIPK